MAARVKNRVLISSFCYLTLAELANASRTCKGWHEAARESELWQALVNRDFNVTVHLDDWKTEYCRFLRVQQTQVRNGSKKLYRYSIKDRQLSTTKLPELDRSSRIAYMDDGTVIITGGDRFPLSAWLFNSVTEEFKALPNMLQQRRSHSSVYFQQSVLVIAGYDGKSILNTVESWDGIQWTQHSQLEVARFRHTAVVADSEVYVMSGYNRMSFLTNIEHFDGVKWSLLPFNLTEKIYGVGLIHLAGKEVLILGGRDYQNYKRNIFKLSLKNGALQRVGELQVPDHFYSTGVNLRKELVILGVKGVHVVSHAFESRFIKFS